MSVSAKDMRPETSPLVSVVLPLYNESAVLRQLAGAVRDVLTSIGCRAELVFVNDGSTDDSGAILDQLARRFSDVHVLHLSRNFGHQAAVLAGLQHARGDAVVVMDTDLQDDPASLADFVERWRQGFDVVYAIRRQRKEASWKRALFFGFYRLLNWASDADLPTDAGNFSLMDRRVVEQVAALVECDRYFPGLRHWVGFRQTGVPVERLARHDRVPRVSLGGLFRLAKTAVISFSRLPLTAFYAIALLSMTVCTGCSLFTLYHRLITGLAIPGWTSITMTASFFGAINALGIGILGEYVVRIYDQVRQRPRYIVARDSWTVDSRLRQAEHVDGEERELLAATQGLQRMLEARSPERVAATNSVASSNGDSTLASSAKDT